MLARYRGKTTCPECNGSRLKPHAEYVKINGASITDLVKLPIKDLMKWFEELELSEHDQQIAQRILTEIKNRLSENYTLDEVDEVCESLRNYKRNMSKLGFSLVESLPVNSKVVVNNDQAAHIAANPDDVIDKSLLDLIN
jgi:excinuclease ABC subunit A